MSAVVLALVLSVAASTWIYAKMFRRNGGQAKDSIMVAGIAAVVIFLVAWQVAKLLPGL